MTQANHHQIATYLTDYALSELVRYVMEDTGCGLEQAMEQVYNSPLMSALQDEENELYVQSPAYLYEMLQTSSTNQFCWQSETREQMLEEFMQTRPTNTDISEDDIMNEVRAVRYA